MKGGGGKGERGEGGREEGGRGGRGGVMPERLSLNSDIIVLEVVGLQMAVPR